MNKEKIASASEKVEPKQRANLSGRSFAFLRIVFVCLIGGGLGYLTFMFVEQDKAIELLFLQQSQLLEGRASGISQRNILEGSIQTLTQELLAANDRQEEQGLELERLNREVISTRLRINDNGTASNAVWTLAEAESLLRLAHQRLIMSQDVRAALALFVASDDILKQINDPAIFSIRNILASDMAALRAVAEIDIQGIYLQLGALSKSINSLQVVSGSGEQQRFEGRGEGIDASQKLEAGFFSSILQTLSTYIVITQRDEPVRPMLNAEHEVYLKQKIQLLLEQARLGLLQEREDVYSSSISLALEDIEQYLESTDEQKQSVVNALKNLLEVSIVQQVPAVSNSLIALQQILPLSANQTSEAGAL